MILGDWTNCGVIKEIRKFRGASLGVLFLSLFVFLNGLTLVEFEIKLAMAKDMDLRILHVAGKVDAVA